MHQLSNISSSWHQISQIFAFPSFCLDICAHLTHFQGNCCGEWVAGVEKLLFSAHSLILGLGKKRPKTRLLKTQLCTAMLGWSRQVSLFGFSNSLLCAFGIVLGRGDVQIADLLSTFVGRYIYNTLQSLLCEVYFCQKEASLNCFRIIFLIIFFADHICITIRKDVSPTMLNTQTDWWPTRCGCQ